MKIQNEGSSFSHLRIGSSNCMKLLLLLGVGLKGQIMMGSAVWSIVPQLQPDDDLKLDLDKQ